MDKILKDKVADIITELKPNITAIPATPQPTNESKKPNCCAACKNNCHDKKEEKVTVPDFKDLA
jgi:hypothetical protein